MKYLISKLRSYYGVVCKIKSLVNKDSLLLLYHSLINSHLQYCISNWCFGNSTLITKLQQICNKFLRMVFELPYCSNINGAMKQCNILKINQLYKLETSSLMFKLIQGGNTSPYSCNLHSNPCKYNTRNKAQYITHHCISIRISISIFYFCSATTKTERNKQTYRTIAEEEKGRSN